MKESPFAESLVAEGEVKQAMLSVVAVLEARFERIPPELELSIRGQSELPKLQQWLKLAAKATTLDAFRKDAGI